MRFTCALLFVLSLPLSHSFSVRNILTNRPFPLSLSFLLLLLLLLAQSTPNSTLQILGYNENKRCPEGCPRTGSHNIVVGTHNWYKTSGGYVGGSQNGIVGRLSSITGGFSNVAIGLTSHVSGVSVNLLAVRLPSYKLCLSHR